MKFDQMTVKDDCFSGLKNYENYSDQNYSQKSRFISTLKTTQSFPVIFQSCFHIILKIQVMVPQYNDSIMFFSILT